MSNHHRVLRLRSTDEKYSGLTFDRSRLQASLTERLADYRVMYSRLTDRRHKKRFDAIEEQLRAFGYNFGSTPDGNERTSILRRWELI